MPVNNFPPHNKQKRSQQNGDFTCVICFVILISIGFQVFAESAPVETNSFEVLRQLIERQNRKIEELTEKVKQLEAHEKAAGEGSNSVQLPAIIIDTNGVPVETNTTAQSTNTNVVAKAEVSMGANGFSAVSADKDYSFRLHGLVQLDSRTFFKDNAYSDGNDGFLLRRARPIFETTVFRNIDGVVVPEFGGSSVQLYDAYLNYRLSSGLQLRAGKFKGPVGLENLQTDAAASFNERSLVSDFIPMRNTGVELHGDLDHGTIQWAGGVFNGDGDSRLAGNSPYSDDLEYAGRLFLQPFAATDATYVKGVGFGIGASYSEVSSNSSALPSTTGGTLPGYVSPGQQQFFAYNPTFGNVVGNGSHWRISPQGYYYVGPFGVLTEYIITEQDVLNTGTLRRAHLDHSAWQVSGQWVLTGEPASFEGIKPARPFSPLSGGWGAWQLVARYSELDLDDQTFKGFSDSLTSARGAQSWSVGLNWWLTQNVRVLTSFSATTFEGGGKMNVNDASTLSAPATISHQTELLLCTRLQLAF